ncbi:MAG: hypothetical protein GVY18_06575 [Bacteroidetes bacterium]|nr:hypothetical protein [Bacteroidota bacterium]
MKNQYFGDVNDFRKYGLLRALLDRTALPLYVAWMLTPDDDRTDGVRTRYLSQPARWRVFDPPLFDLLVEALSDGGAREVAAIERSGLLPRATFHSAVLSDQREERAAYFEALGAIADPPGMLFFDPDNGLEVASVPKGRKDSSKYLYWDEVASAWGDGHSLLIYQHFPRRPREVFIKEVARRLRRETGAPWVASFRTAHVVFLLAPQPSHRDPLLAGTRAAATTWDSQVDVALHRVA